MLREYSREPDIRIQSFLCIFWGRGNRQNVQLIAYSLPTPCQLLAISGFCQLGHKSVNAAPTKTSRAPSAFIFTIAELPAAFVPLVPGA